MLVNLIRKNLKLFFPFLRFISFVKSNIFSNKNGKLRILIFHDIPPEDESVFSNLLIWLSKRWNFITPNEFEKIIKGESPNQGDNLLLTFDDGFRSSFTVAEKYLNPMNIKALFFVVSDFISINDPIKSKKFISDNIIPGMSPDLLPKHMLNMSWNDLRSLINQGHFIGAHTKTHAKTSEISNLKKLENEIIDSANYMGKKLDYDIKHFAFTFGDFSSMSKQALTIASKRFDYIHTGLRGNNSFGVKKWAIRRDPANLADSLWLIGSFLEGLADWRYANDLLNYESWISNN